MDKFEEFHKNITGKDATWQATTTVKQEDRCVCGRCPTYNECMREKGEIFYCINGRSPVCTFDKKECICPTCPVKFSLALRKTYYCIRGSEKDQGATQSPKKS